MFYELFVSQKVVEVGLTPEPLSLPSDGVVLSAVAVGPVLTAHLGTVGVFLERDPNNLLL